MGKLKDKVVWITGASSGIGEALVGVLSTEQVKIILSARRESELMRVAQQSGLKEDSFMILPIDLDQQSDFERKGEEVLKKFGRIDILINNGGISQRSLAAETPVEVDRKIFETNFFGTIALTKSLLPVFLRQKDGMIVTITSAVGKFGSPWRSGYAASKHALHGFFDSLRAELYNDNVKVLLVCPGFIQTNVSVNAITAKGEKLGSMDKATAGGLTAKDCAAQIVSAIVKEKEEVVIAGFREKLGVYVKRFRPTLFSIMIRKMAVR